MDFGRKFRGLLTSYSDRCIDNSRKSTNWKIVSQSNIPGCSTLYELFVKGVLGACKIGCLRHHGVFLMLLRGWFDIPNTSINQVRTVTQVTIVTKVTWGFPTRRLPKRDSQFNHFRTQKKIGFHAKYPLLWPDVNQNWNFRINFSRSPRYCVL